uniref:Transmembrane protein 41A n=1 Tax=Oryzias melastigma TaxID=30732 RepID=A0A3B3B4Z2_ORYME
MRSLAGLAAIVAAASVYLYVLSTHLPPGPKQLPAAGEGEDAPELELRLKFPSDLESLRELADMLKFYKRENYGYVLLLFCSAYLYKQSFAIPGSSFLVSSTQKQMTHAETSPQITCENVFDVEFLLVISEKCISKFKFCETVLSFPLEHASWGDLRALGGSGVGLPARHFRLNVLLPPVLGVWEAVCGPLVSRKGRPAAEEGLIPYNFICVRTGSILAQISSLDDIFSWGTLAQLLAIALVALVPGALIKHYSKTRLKVDGLDSNGSGQGEMDRKRR